MLTAILKLLVILLCPLYLFGQPATHSTSGFALNGICYTTHFEVMIPGAKDLKRFDEKTYVYTLRDLVLYQKPIFGNNSNTGVLTGDSVNYAYFTKYLNAEEGLYYDTNETVEGEILKASSFMNGHLALEEGMFNSENDKLIDIRKKGKYERIEVYIPQVKTDDSYCDTTFLFFSKGFGETGFSLSKNLEKQRDLKLVKVVMLYNEAKKNGKDDFLPRREMIFEIEKIAILNPEQFKKYFDRHERVLKKP